MPKVTEDCIPFGTYRVYLRTVGEKNEKPPLLVIHGGPGASHDYLTTLDDLAERGRQVIYYDQCGCGRSGSRSGVAPWSIDFFVGELQAVSQYLNLERFHVLGHSWGGLLAIRFAHAGPKGLAGLVLVSSPVSIAQWNFEIFRLLSEMPDEQRRALEQGRTHDKRGYREALELFFRRHICRMGTIPDFVWRSVSQMGEVHRAFQGDSELILGGALSGVDLTPLLPGIHVPALVMAGKHGKCTHKVVQTLLDGIAGSRSVILEKSAHLPHVEERETFNEALEAFLAEADLSEANLTDTPRGLV